MCHCNDWICPDCDIRMCEGCVGEDDPRCPNCTWSPLYGHKTEAEAWAEEDAKEAAELAARTKLLKRQAKRQAKGGG